MRRFVKFLTRSSAFLGKEIIEVLRQPRLILALIFGPFLILLLFGLGYNDEPRAVQTLFVAGPSSPLAAQIEENAPTISPQLVYVGLISDEIEARRLLGNGRVDMVVVAPEDAYETIQNDQQAVFQVYHNEIDPTQIGYLEYLGQIYVEEVNRRVLSSIAEQGQQEASDVHDDVRIARENAAAMRMALQAGDIASARNNQREMRNRIAAVSLAVGASAGLLSGVEGNVGSDNNSSNAQEIMGLINSLQENPSNTGDIQEGRADYSQEIQELERTETELADLEERLTEFQRVSPGILTRPFATEVQSLSPVQFTPLDFFTPGVIALLLQHIAVTISSLSLVREKRSGILELFRISPISAGETLIGKYLSYLIFGGVLAAALALLLAYGLQIPMRGDWLNFALVAFVLIFASLGLGFIISLISNTESQAVQLAMIALLLSVFFSGFMLDLRYFWAPVRIVSWLLPATYARELLQGIMLRGQDIFPLLIGGLVGIGVVLLILSWILLRRRMAHE
jgi:ABC-2 type transport system permease protein